MVISTPPTAEAVRTASRLRPEEVSRDYTTTTQLETDITKRLTDYTAVINKKLTNVEDTAQNQVIAAKALSLRVLASLYGSAGYLNPAYWERAQALKAESADLLDDLTGTSPDELTASGGAATTLSTAPYLVDSVGLPVVNGPYYD